MISFDAGTHRFNLRAAAVVLHGDHVLLHQCDGDDYWSLPGGRVEPGEVAAQTVVREMAEEVGASVVVERMLWIVENFFCHDGRQNHEVGMYFAATLAPGSPLLDLSRQHRGVEQSRGLTFAWFRRDGLRDLDVRPRFLGQQLMDEPTGLKHIVQHNPDAEALK
ncbi:MAG: NUDIX domain-containing protein [Pseudomonadota bacterium]|jgi:ADP-ribose pyrophosphatase YjhB (NUDIX family)|uniref:NUDIX hydrolase n=1 Tax=Burkholderiaceae TaxID=119060 RepID=UPI0010F7E7E9|nr:NUDIX domain-containing protein [Burkholderia sp. 4M9327F10]